MRGRPIYREFNNNLYKIFPDETFIVINISDNLFQKITIEKNKLGKLLPNLNSVKYTIIRKKVFTTARKKAFKDMWDHSIVFARFRNLNVESCITCPRFDFCRGGCPAMAYHTYHDINMPDPECLINLKVGLESESRHV